MSAPAFPIVGVTSYRYVVTIEHRIEASHHIQKEIEQLGFDSDELLIFIPPRTSPQGDPRGLSANHGILDVDWRDRTDRAHP